MDKESITQYIADRFDDEQAGPILVLFGNITALKHLVTMMWTDRLAQTDNPVEQAEQLKEQVLRLADADLDEPFEEQTHMAMVDCLDSIIARVRSL